MFASWTVSAWRNFFAASAVVGFGALVLLVGGSDRMIPAAEVSTGHEAHAPVAVAPLAEQASAKIIVDPPLPELLTRGVVFIRYRTENLQIVPVFGPAALAVSPRIGHLHVTVDDAPWHWANTSGEPIIVAGLTPGLHKILIEAANANHEPIAQGVVEFEVP